MPGIPHGSEDLFTISILPDTRVPVFVHDADPSSASAVQAETYVAILSELLFEDTFKDAEAACCRSTAAD